MREASNMKAAVRSKYGSSEVLSIREVDAPAAKDNEVLVRVYATTVNRSDCHVLWGKPFVMRLALGLFKPRRTITGSDFAGQIEAVGKNVKSFKVGDRVMGFGGVFGIGSHAQYLAFPESKAITVIPGRLTYEQAAACLEGAVYASMGIKALKPSLGQKALIYGATGAIGSSYIQFLKYLGVYVTAVCGGENWQLVKLLGADKVIDYKTQDFTRDNERYDLIIDAVGKSTFAKCKPLLKSNGLFSSASGFINIFLAMITPLLGGKKVVSPVPKDLKINLDFIKDLIEKGSFRPVIDRRYTMNQIAEAFNYVASGQKIGNVVITMDA